METTTGPLGQGFANGVGMAIAERFLAAMFNAPASTSWITSRTCIASDGDLMEGISHEAASFAGHLKLGKLIVLYDDNHITIDGPTDLAFTEDVARASRPITGRCSRSPTATISRPSTRPSAPPRPRPDGRRLSRVRTHIGYGSPTSRTRSRRTARRWAPTRSRLDQESLGWPLEPVLSCRTTLRHFDGGSAGTRRGNGGNAAGSERISR